MVLVMVVPSGDVLLVTAGTTTGDGASGGLDAGSACCWVTMLSLISAPRLGFDAVAEPLGLPVRSQCWRQTAQRNASRASPPRILLAVVRLDEVEVIETRIIVSLRLLVTGRGPRK